MILRANPNRMELLRLRKRLLLARRGHKLLQDKLEEMMRRFLMLLKDVDAAKADFSERTARVNADLLYCRMTRSGAEFSRSLAAIESRLSLEVASRKIMNVRVPDFQLTGLEVETHYDFFTTSAQLDVVVAGAGDYMRSLLKLAQLLKALQILSTEIERTRRRVNALEHMLIPSIEGSIRLITQKLNEFERGNLVRLMRVKEIVRCH